MNPDVAQWYPARSLSSWVTALMSGRAPGVVARSAAVISISQGLSSRLRLQSCVLFMTQPFPRLQNEDNDTFFL